MNNTASRPKNKRLPYCVAFAVLLIAFCNQSFGNLDPDDKKPDPDNCPPPVEGDTGGAGTVSSNGGGTSGALRAPDETTDTISPKPFVTEMEHRHGKVYTLPKANSATNKCVSFSIPFPVLALESSLGTQNFSIKRDDPTPALFTPQSLSYTSMVASYVNSITESADLPSGVSHKFELKNQRWENMEFEVPTGSNTGTLVGDFTGEGYTVQLLDQNLELTTGDPDFFRLQLGNGGYIDYPAIQSRVPSSMMLASGRLLDLQTGDGAAFDFVFKDGAFRQIRSTSGLADIVVVDDYGYEINFYTVDNTGDKIDGKYVPIGDPYRVVEVRNPTGDPDLHDVVRITDTQGSYSRIYQWIHVSAADEWVLTEGIDPTDADAIDPDTGMPVDPKTLTGIVSEQKFVTVDPATGDSIITTELRDGDGELISKNQARERFFENRRSAYVEEIEDVDGIALTTTRDYYTDASEAGRSGNLKSVVYPDGSWVKYDYDSDSRPVQTIRPWLDSPLASTAVEAQETTFDYTPVDSRDVAGDYDARARTIITKVLGEETERTYRAYFTDSGEYTEIIERTTVQEAAYGDSSNLRTTRVYYASDADAASAGRLKSVATPDGVVLAYSYTQPDIDSDLIQTVDHITSSGPLANKSTRRVRTIDVRGNLVKEESYVHDGNNWQLVTTTTQSFSDEITVSGYQMLERIKDGRTILEQSWYGPLVAGMTDEAGAEYMYDYDLIDRLSMSVKLGANGRENIIATYDRDLGAIGCGCDGSSSVTYTADGITLNSIQKTDAVGRRSEMIDQNGYRTTYSYVNDRRIVTQTLPNGATHITEKYLDGRIKSVTGTAVVPEYYNYSVNSDGSTSTRVEIASQDSPRLREMTYDVAGRMIREETPSYTGAAITRTMEYNSFGLLWKQTETGRATTIFEYDALANLIRSGLDIDNSGMLVPFVEDQNTDNDRITDIDRFMEQDAAGDWFEIQTTTIYSDEDSADSVEVSRTARRISNFPLAGTHGDLVSETIATDVHGNDVKKTIYVNRLAKTVKRIINAPDTDIDAVTTLVNGLLVSQNSSTVAAATTYDYDAIERLISVKDPRHSQAASIDYYTDSKQIFTQTDGAGNTTAFTYFPQGEAGAGQIDTVTDARLQKSYREYDLLGRQIRSWGETDYPQAYSYNAYGELVTLTTWRDTNIDFSTSTWPAWDDDNDTLSEPVEVDSAHPEASVTTWSYQSATGLLTRKEYADGNGTDYSYDSANRLHVRTWARDGGLDTTYSYDSATGELLNVNYEAADTADITYTYDRLGRLDSVTDATGNRIFDYDTATLQLDTETLDSAYYDGHILARSYEDGTEANGLLGRNKGYSLLDGGQSSVSAATYAYESTGRLKTVSDGSDTFTYGYEPNSNLLASITAPQHTVAYDYEDNRNIMTVIDNKLPGASTSASTYTYTYDELSRREDREQSGSAFTVTNKDTFAYNTRSEVTGSTNDDSVLSLDPDYTPVYTYDQIGNRLTATGGVLGTDSATYTSNELNQYTAISAPTAVSPTYDLDGNLETDGTWTYAWNNENRLINSTDGSVSIDFAYDYMGRLVTKQVSTYDSGSDLWTLTSNLRYVYDGWNRIATFEEDSSFVLSHLSSCLWGLDLSGSMQGAGGVGGLLKEGDLYPAYDANGNITQKLDGAGSLEMNVDYDPFGNIIRGTLEGEYGFSTKPLIDGIHMYYYGFRYYDPGTGRWPNRDPIGERGGLNLYAMVGNDAVDLWDLLGQKEAGCCDKDAISESEEVLNERYQTALKYFRDNKIPRKGKGNQSCKNVSSDLLLFLAPIPKCWECRLEAGNRWKVVGPFGVTSGPISDHQTVICSSNPDNSKSGPTEELNFDIWLQNDGPVDPSGFREKYWRPQPVSPPDGDRILHDKCDTTYRRLGDDDLFDILFDRHTS